MLTIDFSVIEDWMLGHKLLSILLLSAGFAGVIYFFLLRHPWSEQRLDANEVLSERQQLVVMRKSTQKKSVIKLTQRDRIATLEKQLTLKSETMPPALWLNHQLTQCDISHYVFVEEPKVPPGGQGRPTFNLSMQLSYQQVLCVLSKFAEDSAGWELSSLALSINNENKLIEMNVIGYLPLSG